MPKKIIITGPESFAGMNFIQKFKNKYTLIDNSENLIKNINSNCFLINFDAMIEAPPSLEFPLTYFKYNVVKTLRLLEAVRKSRNEIFFIQPGSNLPYGNPIYHTVDENHPLNPQSPYAATRVCQETLLQSYHNSYGIPMCILRLSNGYGPYGKGVINHFIENGLRGKMLLIKGGTQARTFTHIYDYCNAIDLVIKNPKKANGEIFNVSSEDCWSVELIAKHISKLLNIPYMHEKNDRGDISKRQFVTSKKARTILGYKPKFRVKNGINQVIGWQKKQNKSAGGFR